MLHRMTGVAAALILATGVVQAHAQSSWSDPDGGYDSNAPSGGSSDDQMQSLVDALNKELDRGEKERLLDPWFLRDLRGIISQYDWPWGKPILSDSFDSNGPQPEAPWQVTAGEFLIDWRHGLRSIVNKGSAASAASSSGGSGSNNDDPAKQLLGALLQGALGGTQPSTKSAPTQSNTQFSAVQATISIPNAFAIDMEVTQRELVSGKEDGFEFGPYQGANAAIGYRLTYVAGTGGRPGDLNLLRLSSRGVTTVETSNRPITFLGASPSRIVWTRDGQGRMQVQVDDAIVIDTIDRSFKDPFDGFAVLNRGGDIALRQITISGAGS